MREIFLTKARPLAKYLIAGTVLIVVNLWAAGKLELLAGLLAGYGSFDKIIKFRSNPAAAADGGCILGCYTGVLWTVSGHGHRLWHSLCAGHGNADSLSQTNVRASPIFCQRNFQVV